MVGQRGRDRLYASPVVVDGVVYVGTQGGTLRALDAADGTSATYTVTATHGSSAQILAAVAVSDGTVHRRARRRAHCRGCSIRHRDGSSGSSGGSKRRSCATSKSMTSSMSAALRHSARVLHGHRQPGLQFLYNGSSGPAGNLAAGRGPHCCGRRLPVLFDGETGSTVARTRVSGSSKVVSTPVLKGGLLYVGGDRIFAYALLNRWLPTGDAYLCGISGLQSPDSRLTATFADDDLLLLASTVAADPLDRSPASTLPTFWRYEVVEGATSGGAGCTLATDVGRYTAERMCSPLAVTQFVPDPNPPYACTRTEYKDLIESVSLAIGFAETYLFMVFIVCRWLWARYARLDPMRHRGMVGGASKSL